MVGTIVGQYGWNIQLALTSNISRIKFIKPLYTKGLNVRNSEARALGRISIRKDLLELNNAGIEDSGNYSCKVKAWQTDEYDSITYTLTVLGK